MKKLIIFVLVFGFALQAQASTTFFFGDGKGYNEAQQQVAWCFGDGKCYDIKQNLLAYTWTPTVITPVSNTNVSNTAVVDTCTPHNSALQAQVDARQQKAIDDIAKLQKGFTGTQSAFQQLSAQIQSQASADIAVIEKGIDWSCPNTMLSHP